MNSNNVINIEMLNHFKFMSKLKGCKLFKNNLVELMHNHKS